MKRSLLSILLTLSLAATCSAALPVFIDNHITDYPLHGHVTTDTGGAETDYTGAGSTPFDLTLIADAPAKAAGTVPYLDIGALQRQEPAGSSGSAGGRTFNEGFQN